MGEAFAWSPGQLAQLACIAEVVAPKAGNVHPGAAFEGTTWLDFVASAVAAAPVFDRAAELGVGATILEAVRATRAAVGQNTNLGMILLLAPLCAVSPSEPLREGVERVLSRLAPADAAAAFEAIRLAKPGGLGRVERGDVAERSSLGLIEAMTLAARRDSVARQYANGFADVIGVVAPRIAAAREEGLPLTDAIVQVHLRQMADEPDSLIRRKCGEDVAAESSRRARAVLDAAWPHEGESKVLFEQLDAWLRADGNRRNPGTSADLIAAALFAVVRRSARPQAA